MSGNKKQIKAKAVEPIRFQKPVKVSDQTSEDLLNVTNTGSGCSASFTSESGYAIHTNGPVNISATVKYKSGDPLASSALVVKNNDETDGGHALVLKNNGKGHCTLDVENAYSGDDCNYDRAAFFKNHSTKASTIVVKNDVQNSWRAAYFNNNSGSNPTIQVNNDGGGQSACFINNSSNESTVKVINEGGGYSAYFENQYKDHPTIEVSNKNGGNAALLNGKVTIKGDLLLQDGNFWTKPQVDKKKGENDVLVCLVANAKVTNTDGGDGYQKAYWASEKRVSDERLKKNIKALNESVLSKLMALRVVTYEWNERANKLQTEHVDKTIRHESNSPEENKIIWDAEKRSIICDLSSTQLGFIAQELEEIFPELVSTRGDGYKTVKSSELIPMVVKGISELKKEKDEEIERLREENKNIMNRIKCLENALLVDN